MSVPRCKECCVRAPADILVRVKLASRLLMLAALAVGGYLFASWYLPRRAAKRDLAGIEARLEVIEKNMAILLDRVTVQSPVEEDDPRLDSLVDALQSLTEAMADEK